MHFYNNATIIIQVSYSQPSAPCYCIFCALNLFVNVLASYDILNYSLVIRHGERYGDKKRDVEVRCEDIVPTARVFSVGVRLKVILEEQVYYIAITNILQKFHSTDVVLMYIHV